MDEQMLDALRELQKDPFGLVIAKLRKERGLSQAALAKAADLSRPYVADPRVGIETGHGSGNGACKPSAHLG